MSVVGPGGCGGSTLHYLVAGFLDVDLDRSRNREEVVASEAFAERKNTVWGALREETPSEVQA